MPIQIYTHHDIACQICYESNQSVVSSLQANNEVIPEVIANLPKRDPARDSIELYLANFNFLNYYFSRCVECNRYDVYLGTVYMSDGSEREVCDCCRGGYYYWDRDDCYHEDPEPPRCGVRGYHSTPRDELFAGVDFNDPGLLGIELETYVIGEEYEIEKTVQKVLECGPITAEEDASLDYDNGVEFVFAPVTLDKVQEGEWVHNVIQALKGKARAWDEGDGYGMHISINAAKMNKLHIGRFCHFIHRHKNFCCKIAGRYNEDYADYQPQRKASAYLGMNSKYFAAAVRSESRIEVRIFRSSLNWERFRRNCEFIDALREFTKITMNKQCTVDNFVKFVSDKEQYKLIYEFIKPKQTASV